MTFTPLDAMSNLPPGDNSGADPSHTRECERQWRAGEIGREECICEEVIDGWADEGDYID